MNEGPTGCQELILETFHLNCTCAFFNVQYTILPTFQMKILLWVGGGVAQYCLSVWDRPGTICVVQAGLELVPIFLTWPSAIFQIDI